MDALSGGAHGFSWWYHRPSSPRRRRNGRERGGSCDASSESVEPVGARAGFQFPLKQALTAGSLALVGDTIAQVRERLRGLQKQELRSPDSDDDADKDVLWSSISRHDWLRALRMTSYGFLLYGPGCYVWYRYLDRQLPQQTVRNLILKVLLNQVILGPCVIAVVLAWNNLWLRKLSDLPRKYKEDFLPTLFYGEQSFTNLNILHL
ncbi:hypothetical protein Dimus_009472 [Dionaea muscipula]